MKSIIRKNIILFIIACGSFCVVAFGLWRFGLAMEVKRNRVIAAKELLASYEINKKTIAQEAGAIESITNRLNRLEQYQVTPLATPDLLSSLEALAQKQAVDFTIAAVQTPVEGSTKKLVIDFSAKGSANAVEVFLEALNHQSYQVQFDRFSLSAGVAEGGKSSRWDVLASIEIRSF